MFKETGNLRDVQLLGQGGAISRKMVIAGLLGVALIAFEIFNFDTTQYALSNLLGDIRFVGVLWASILAIAFCAIDFAGLVRLFTPQRGAEEPRAVWFLTGAWFLGTIANAVMTWWAVSLTLLGHDFGNEVLSRGVLLRYVPIFVAMLVWLTRILFIGAFSIAGEDVLARAGDGQTTTARRPSPQPAAQPVRAARPEPQMASSPAPGHARPPHPARRNRRPRRSPTNPSMTPSSARRPPPRPAPTAPCGRPPISRSARPCPVTASSARPATCAPRAGTAIRKGASRANRYVDRFRKRR